jgi:hypothetical protein
MMTTTTRADIPATKERVRLFETVKQKSNTAMKNVAILSAMGDIINMR